MVLRSCTYIIPVNCRKINSSECISWNICVFSNNVIVFVITMERGENSNLTSGGHDETTIGATFDDIMAGADITGEDMADVPEKCRDCPVLKRNLGEIACIRKEVQEGLNADPEELKKRLLMMREAGHEALARLTEGQISQIAASATSHQQREALATLNNFDQQSGRLQDGVNRLTGHCAGPLKMRGSRDGKTVTVTSCMSGIIAHSGKTGFADVHYS